MKTRSLLLVIAFLALNLGLMSHAYADMDSMNGKITELEVEAEVDELEAYGEAAREKQNKEESQRLRKEARQLKAEIRKLKRDKIRAKKKASLLAQRYEKSYTFQSKVKRQADQSERERNRRQDQVDRMAKNLGK